MGVNLLNSAETEYHRGVAKYISMFIEQSGDYDDCGEGLRSNSERRFHHNFERYEGNSAAQVRRGSFSFERPGRYPYSLRPPPARLVNQRGEYRAHRLGRRRQFRPLLAIGCSSRATTVPSFLPTMDHDGGALLIVPLSAATVRRSGWRFLSSSSRATGSGRSF